METNKSEIADIFQQMTKFVATVTSDFSKTVSKLKEVLNKMSSCLNVEDCAELERLFIALSGQDRTDLAAILKTGDTEKTREWLSQKTKNQNIINAVILYTDVINHALGSDTPSETTQSKEETPQTTDGLKETKGETKQENSLTDILGYFLKQVNFGSATSDKPVDLIKVDESKVPKYKEYYFSSVTVTIPPSDSLTEKPEDKTETTQEKPEENKPEETTAENKPEENKYFLNEISEFLSNHLIKDATDATTLKTEVQKAKQMWADALTGNEQYPEDKMNIFFKGLAKVFELDEADLPEINKSIDKIFDKIQEKVTTSDTPSSTQSEIKPKSGVPLFDNFFTAQPMCDSEKVTKTITLINSYNQLSDEINDATKGLNSFEISQVEAACGGLPMNFRLRMLENRLESMDEKLSKDSEKEKISQEYTELSEKIDDIAINLNLLLNKLSKIFT